MGSVKVWILRESNFGGPIGLKAHTIDPFPLRCGEGLPLNLCPKRCVEEP